jgi:hypothetical protein
MQTFTCHVTRRDDIPRRVEVQASDRTAAMRAALGGRSGRVSCRPMIDQTALVADALGVRISSFPLVLA